MVGACGHNARLDSGDGCGFDQDTRTATLILDDGRLREAVNLEASLVSINTAPDETVTVAGDRKGVMGTTNQLGNLLSGERFHNFRVENSSLVLASTLLDTSLTEAVEAPRVHLARLMNGKRVESTTADLDDVLGKTKLTRLESVQLVTLHNAAAQLVLLTRAPRINGAFLAECKHMIVTTSEMSDLLERGDQDGARLYTMFRVKPENTIVALGTD